MRDCIKSCLLLLFFSTNINSFAQSELITLDVLPDSALSIRTQLQIFEDESTVRTWEEVYVEQQNGKFKPFETYQFKPSLDRGKSDYWFFFSIDFLSTKEERVLLRQFGEGSLVFYHLKDGQLIRQRKAGNLFPNDDTDAQYAFAKNDFPTTLQPGKNEFLVFKRTRPSYYPQHTQPILLKEAFAMPKAEKYLLLFFTTNGVFLGILFFVLLFSLVQYFQTKDLAFLGYAIYVLTLFLYFLRYFGLHAIYFRFLPAWTFDLSQHTLFNHPIFIAYLVFLRFFLNTKKTLPRLDLIIRIGLGLVIGYFFVHRVMMYIDWNLAYRVDKYVRLIFLVLNIGVFVLLLRAGQNKLVKYILIGSFSLVSCTLIGLLVTYNDDQSWGWWDKGNTMAQIGVLIELFCFSMGLGYKTQLIEEERNQVKNDLGLKQQEARQLKELDQFKDRFYTNISHEFRTPLTVIQGLAQQLQDEPNKDLYKRSALIQSNTHNLLNLVNKLLDLSKAEVGQLTLNFIQKDIIKYIGYITESFHSLAYSKKVNLSFYTNIDKQLMDYDATIIKSLLTNLIANALKFTPEYGKIMVVTDVLDEQMIKTVISSPPPNCLIIKSVEDTINQLYLRIKVMDTGDGINAAQLPNIFDRFFQADHSIKNANQGTGLGLALVKELVLLLKGFIKVESRLNEGSTFSIYLPVQQAAALESETASFFDKSEEVVLPPDKIAMSVIPTLEKQELAITKSDKPILLIAEDNADVIYYLKSCVGEDYEVLEARNGKIALDIALKHIPDIILSDVMMPELDGYELCTALKKDARTSHIPIVLLTAKATLENKKTGLSSGADAYLIKPFDKKELLIRLENLVLLRKQIQLYIQLNSHTTIKETLVSTKIAENEIEFLQTLKQTVKINIQDAIFKAPQLARAMAMSQTQLYRKIKALTNQSTAQYIRNIRLEAAKNLIETTDFSIGRISLEVGFKNQAHFSKSFQNEYGFLPSSIRK